MLNLSYSQIAHNIDFWHEYADIEGLYTDEEFYSMSHDEKISILIECFGPEAENTDSPDLDSDDLCNSTN